MFDERDLAKLLWTEMFWIQNIRWMETKKYFEIFERSSSHWICKHYIKKWKDNLEEDFFTTDNTDISDFLSLKYETGKNINEYIHTKINIGKKLELSKNLILEILLEGLISSKRQNIVLKLH